jgi:hypothetical protein
MKRMMLVVSTLVIALFCSSCASTANFPKQIPDALNAACDTYSKAKPEVLKAREYAMAHWNDKVPGSDRDIIPAEVKQKLQEFAAFLPKLDTAGLAICSAAEGLSVLSASPDGKVDWNQLLTVVLKGASLAIDLKKTGGF